MGMGSKEEHDRKFPDGVHGGTIDGSRSGGRW